MRPLLALVAFGLIGCDKLFSLTRVEGGVDAASIATADAGCPLPGDPTYHDEDGDQIDDTCDNCPAIKNPAIGAVQQDLDGDHVGDACDPHPTSKGDSIVDFEAFATGFGPWTANGTGWTAGGDSVTSPPGSTTSTMLRLAQLQATLPTLEVHLRVLDLGAANNTYGFWLHLSSAMGDATCNFDYDPTYGHELAALVDGGGRFTSYTPQTGTDSVMVFVRDTPTMSCAIDGSSIDETNNITDVLVTPSIAVDRMQVRIDSLVLYAYAAGG